MNSVNTQAKIVRINGPIVEAYPMLNASIMEMVMVGEKRLVGEIVKLERDKATIQVYEENQGLTPGEPVLAMNEPLSVELGPGMLSNIYDGFQRSLRDLMIAGDYRIMPGFAAKAADKQNLWNFIPTIKQGTQVHGGEVYGLVQENAAIVHKLLIPANLSGKVKFILESGNYSAKSVTVVVTTHTGEQELSMLTRWPIRKARSFKKRIALTTPLITGQRVIDTFFPIAKGGTAAIPGGFGTGKTIAQHSIAKWCDAQIIIYIGCGERGNEMTEVLQEFPKLIDPATGHSLLERTVMIANTSNMPVAAREASLYTGITIAEYFRDMGYDVALMADSTSRWAEALRELSSRLEEIPADEGFPAYLPARLADFYERAGRVQTLGGEFGSVSIIGTISPPGGDFSEPVTQHTSRFVRCFWALDRDLAYARHYPAISWLTSYSEYAIELLPWWQGLSSNWLELRDKIMALLQEEIKLERIAKLVGVDALPEKQRLILFLAEIIKNSFLQQNSYDPIDSYCSSAKQIRLLKILVNFCEASEKYIDSGGKLLAIKQLVICQDIQRAKETIKSDNLEAFDRLQEALEHQFSGLSKDLN